MMAQFFRKPQRLGWPCFAGLAEVGRELPVTGRLASTGRWLTVAGRAAVTRVLEVFDAIQTVNCSASEEAPEYLKAGSA